MGDESVAPRIRVRAETIANCLVLYVRYLKETHTPDDGCGDEQGKGDCSIVQQVVRIICMYVVRLKSSVNGLIKNTKTNIRST